jgi:glycosyltransferase involved in cell wall biosynthesis
MASKEYILKTKKTKEMNILFIVRNELLPTTGGVERVTSIISDTLKTAGKRVHIIYSGLHEITNPEQHEGISFTFLPNIDNINSNQNCKFIWDFIQQNRIDVAVNQNANFAIAKHLATPRAIKTKIVSCLHTPPLTPQLLFEYHLISSFQPGLSHWVKSRIKSLLRARLERQYFRTYIEELSFIINSSDATVVPSRHHIHEYESILPLGSGANIIAINNPISFPKQDIEQLLRSKSKIVLAVSRLENASKRIDLLLRAWRKIYENHPDWKLIIVGGPKHINSQDPQFRELQRLKRLVRKLKIERVEFAGHQNPISFYEKSSIYAMTSASEAWGMSLVEAQQFGCAPVVFQSFSALREIISQEENGFCVPFGDIDGFANVISLLIDDRALREKVARHAEDSTSRFSQEKTGKDWLNLLETLNGRSDIVLEDHD